LIRHAQLADLPGVLALLDEVGLPTAGVAERFGTFFVVDEGGRIVASAGLELYGQSALLRSLAVVADARGGGHGAAVLRRALHEASERASAVFALTTTAESYLARFGFERVGRDAIPPELFESQELKGACPSSATAMRLIAR
jgi:amino-acid N-acetyltransferase